MASRKFWSGRILIGTVAAIVLVAITSVPSMVSAAPAKKYSLAVSPTTATVGQPTTFTVTMTNVTPPGTNSNPSSFYVTVPFDISGPIELPDTDAEALAGSSNANLSATVDIDPSNPSRILVRSLDAVNKGQFVKLTFTATPESCDPSVYDWVTGDAVTGSVKVTNGASLNGDTFTPNAASETVSTTVTCGPPALSVTKTADATGVAAGETIGFTITVTNSGGGPATGVNLSDVLPTDAGLSWTIDAGTGAGCSISSGTLSCPVGNLAANTSFAVGITSPTTPATVADSPVGNTAIVTATNVTPNPGSANASVAVFTDAITCQDNDPDSEGFTQGGNGTPLTTIERFDNADGSTCVPIPFNQDSSADDEQQVCVTGTNFSQCILLEKDLLGQTQAQFLWTVVWTPEPGEYPAGPTEFDFGTGVFRPLQGCEADGPDVEAPGEPKLPELPFTADPNDGDALDPWCVVNTSSELDVVTGEMTVKETYYGKGDPTGRR